ncbi:MAG: transglutaminase domain-containing protein [Oscillospiraceae bacterium]|nr:transglutaminase domain-containing protein [Oscillospiraceae bacterium]
MPAQPGTAAEENEKAVIDYSNTKDGYVCVKYTAETTNALKVQITPPKGSVYNYNIEPDGKYETFPLSEGNGSYTIGLYEQVEGNKYATVAAVTVDVSLSDQFAPFLRPNQFVNYSKDSQATKKAAELIKYSQNLVEEIGEIYTYITGHITYDKAKASNVKSGYLPSVDATLRDGKGICFDYAALMTAMLRSQGIPCKLVIGEAKDAKGNDVPSHAWISAYSKDTGWIDDVIQFDGKSWKLMDPTYGASANSKDLEKMTTDGKSYRPKFTR